MVKLKYFIVNHHLLILQHFYMRFLPVPLSLSLYSLPSAGRGNSEIRMPRNPLFGTVGLIVGSTIEINKILTDMFKISIKLR